MLLNPNNVKYTINSYPYFSLYALLSGVYASCEGRVRAQAPQAELGGRFHRGRRSPSPEKQTEQSLGMRTPI